jgi:hypothetical protein
MSAVLRRRLIINSPAMDTLRTLFEKYGLLLVFGATCRADRAAASVGPAILALNRLELDGERG